MLLELDLAKPVIYAARGKLWLRGVKGVPRSRAIAELRQTKRNDFVFAPTLEVLRAAFGPEFDVISSRKGVRYDVLEVSRRR